MNTANVLEDIKNFLDEQVANDIKLKKPDNNNAYDFELVKPSVFVGWIPPKSYLPSGLDSTIPCIVVGLDRGSDDTTQSDCIIKLSMATYSPGEYGNEQQLKPSFNGYIDLINLFDKTMAALLKNVILADRYIIEGSVSYGMYEEQPYPYWYGYMTFAIKGKSYPNSNIKKLL